jgi:hypothetical protein
VVAMGAGTAGAQPRDISAQAARGEVRVALVIGNASYAESPLSNPANDARGMAQALRGQGFYVIEKINVDNITMRWAVAEFGERMREGGVGLFYYSGHGMQVNGRNYLVPVDAQIRSENYVGAETLDLDGVLGQMDGARSRVNIVILDACRNNPFARRFRGGQRGLAFMQAPLGTFIAYATSPGDVADDGAPGAYGIFTGELLKSIREPGLKIEDVFKRVGLSVQERTDRRQTPWVASNLTGDFSFAATTLAAVSPVPPPPVAPKIEVQEEIRQQFGTLAISGRLEGIEVWLDDQRMGTAHLGRALVLSNVPEGTHRVKGSKAGYEDWARDVRITANQRAEIVIDIEPLRPEPAGPRVIFEDDFKTTRRWPVDSSPPCDRRYTNEGYVVANNATSGTCNKYLRESIGTLPDRVRIELSFRRLKGALDYGIGLLFGFRAKESYHTLTVAGNAGPAMQLSVYDDRTGAWENIVPWRKDSNVNEGYGVTNTVAVEVRGSSIRCFVNDRFITSATSRHATAGTIGLYLNTPGMEAVFTRLRITELASD